MHWARAVMSNVVFIIMVATFAIGPVRHWWRVPGFLAKACSVLWICAIVGLCVGFRTGIHPAVWFGTLCLVGHMLLLLLAIDKARREAEGGNS